MRFGFGILENLLSDNGPQFAGVEVSLFSDSNNNLLLGNFHRITVVFRKVLT